ncbi:TonB-linked SusC/RagA family outer membrane protein [Maribacter vaceletii]|uniref:TonB-linked SusC/RagA family outer membrane protein n=1 Tax=Maribacter vaceletii TaxID=1206816 RepID=A0A495E6F4_9FLAO|nr:TonB-dependent receptor [Maribacter vaceletii]RKR12139.1 TonB-linked SusC/RagA family outer membrane protein [Maribacter vaceletii]
MKIKKNMNSLVTRPKGALLLMLLLLLGVNNLKAQETTINGTVLSAEDGLPLPGANVVEKGTNNGVVTDFDGNYSIKVSNTSGSLNFSYIGYKRKTVAINGKTTINVNIEVDASELEEVVVIGYGTVKKKELTGAVAQVKAEAIENFVSSDLASTLQGQIAGVSVVSGSGAPGESSSIQIRGVTSLSGTNTPLFVVDGIPQNGDPRLSPNEIETIDVLKDAASTAVYGTRGAAGVILITTKKGKEGKVSVTFDTSYGIQRLGEGVPLMNTQDQLSFNLNVFDYTVNNFDPGPVNNPEWLNNDNKFDDYVLVDNAATTQHNLNITGGSKDFSYNAVVGYFNQEGTLINSGFKRYNARASTSYSSDHWRINGSIAFSLEDRSVTSEGLIVNAQRYAPYFPEVDPDSDVVFTDGSGGVTTPLNILASALKKKDNRNSDRINGSLSVSRDLTKSLSFTSRVGTAIVHNIRNEFVPRYEVIDITDNSSEVDPTKSWVLNNTTRTTKFSWDGSLNYSKKFGNHNVNALTTLSLDEDSFENFTAYKQGVANNNIEILNGTTVNPDAYNQLDNYKRSLIGMLGRVRYDYKGKYLLQGVIRRDGSSKFAPGNRWGVFPSVSAGWNISDENFWESLDPIFNAFKIRASYGEIGNDSFPDYEYASTIEQSRDYIFDENDGDVNFGTAVLSYANSNVKWETSVSKNVGVDLGFFNNKLTLTADYYDTQKEDMLFPVTLPGSAGAYYDNSLTLNVGDMQNTGFELAATYRTDIGKSKLSVNATFSKNENEITKMAGADLIYNSNSTLISGDGASAVSVLAEGYEVGSFFLYETNGVIQDQETLDEYRQFNSRSNAQLGDLIYVDTSGDGDISVADRTYKGSALPDFEIGFNLNWMYKNFDMSMNWFGTVGSEILNGTRAATYSNGRHQDLVNMWTPNNPTSNIPLYQGNSKSGSANYVGTTDYWLEKGDYLRLKLITLGYTLPQDVSDKIGISKLRVYVTGQNPITITNYKGYDPEVGGSNVARRGLDVSRYPVSALYTFGVKLTF